jgi:hypothetical protein
MKYRAALIENIAGRQFASPVAVRRAGSPTSHFAALIAALVLIAVANSARAEAPPIWELRPYKILVLVAPDASPVWTDDRLDALRESLPPRAAALFGAAWEVETTTAGSAVRRSVWSDASDSSMPRAPSPVAIAAELPDAGQYDKLMVLAPAATPAGFAITAREFDTATGLWGVPAARRCARADQVNGEAFVALATAFQPLAQVRPGEGGVATVRVRAFGLPPRDRRLSPLEVGSVFRLARAYTDGDTGGSSQSAESASASYVVVEEVNETGATGTIHTPLGPRVGTSAAQDALLALGVVASHGGTELELVQMGETDAPLAGFDVIARPVDRPQDAASLGRTDRQGRVYVAADETRLWTLDVVVGGQPIARTLMAPGWRERLTWSLPIDSQQMAALAAIDSLHADLVDRVIRREVSLARIQSRLASDETDRARELIDQLRSEQQASRDSLKTRIEQARREHTTGGDAPTSTIALWDRLLGQLAVELDLARIDAALAASRGDDIPPPGWERYTSTDGGFQVLFPGKPTEDEGTADTSVGAIAYRSASLAVTEGESTTSYVVTHAEVPPQLQALPANELLTQAQKIVADVQGFAVEQSNPIDQDGSVGVELTAAQGELRARARLFVVGKRSYQVIVTGTQQEVDSEDATRFLDSFQLTP